MKALILAAGLGTRLMPLTATTPKALVKLNGVTMLELAIRKLSGQGFNEIIVNVHHYARQVIDFLELHDFPGTSISISDESDRLLDTGGAILNARWFLDGPDPFLVHNVDVISDINLHNLLNYHLENKCLATLSVMERQTKRYFLFNEELKLTGWTDTSTREIKWADKPVKNPTKLAFSGIHIINPEFFNLVQKSGRFSVIDTYLGLAANQPVFGYLQEGMTWFDLGKPEQIRSVSEFLSNNPDFMPLR